MEEKPRARCGEGPRASMPCPGASLSPNQHMFPNPEAPSSLLVWCILKSQASGQPRWLTQLSISLQLTSWSWGSGTNTPLPQHTHLSVTGIPAQEGVCVSLSLWPSPCSYFPSRLRKINKSLIKIKNKNLHQNDLVLSGLLWGTCNKQQAVLSILWEDSTCHQALFAKIPFSTSPTRCLIANL